MRSLWTHVAPGMLLASVLAMSVGRVQAQLGVSYTSIWDAIQSDPDLQRLEAFVNVTGILSSLADPALEATLLAPTNSAFQAIPALATLGVGASRVMLALHLVSGVVNMTFAADSIPTLLSVNTDPPNPSVLSTLTVATNDNFAPYVGGAAPGATIDFTSAVTAGQGMIYKIDSVLFPPTRSLLVADTNTSDAMQARALTVREALDNDQDLSLLAELVTLFPEVNDVISKDTTTITFFAPTNAAVQVALDDLDVSADEVRAGGLAGRAFRDAVFLNMLVNRPYTSVTLFPNTYKTAYNVTIDVAEDGAGVITLQLTDPGVTGNSTVARVVQPDMYAGKSIVHKTDAMLLMPGASGANRTALAPASAEPQQQPVTVVLPTGLGPRGRRRQ